jgi:membrane protein DedA with SNARE-associated domain
MVAGIRDAMVVAAGAIRFNFIKFVIADGLAALISGGLFVLLGHWLGVKLGSFDNAVKTVEPYLTLFVIGFALVVAGFIFYRFLRHRGHKAVTDVALETTVAVAEKALPTTAPVAK